LETVSFSELALAFSAFEDSAFSVWTLVRRFVANLEAAKDDAACAVARVALAAAFLELSTVAAPNSETKVAVEVVAAVEGLVVLVAALAARSALVCGVPAAVWLALAFTNFELPVST
jgi:hypothetical protein